MTSVHTLTNLNSELTNSRDEDEDDEEDDEDDDDLWWLIFINMIKKVVTRELALERLFVYLDGWWLMFAIDFRISLLSLHQLLIINYITPFYLEDNNRWSLKNKKRGWEDDEDEEDEDEDDQNWW